MADCILILFGALSIAAGIFGMPAAVALRIGANVLGAAYTVICNKVADKVAEYIGTNKCDSKSFLTETAERYPVISK